MAWTDDLHAQKKPFPVSEVDQNDNALVAAQDGVDATGVSAPAGGVGIRGWLSGIFSKLPTALGGAISSASLPVVIANDNYPAVRQLASPGQIGKQQSRFAPGGQGDNIYHLLRAIRNGRPTLVGSVSKGGDGIIDFMTGELLYNFHDFDTLAGATFAPNENRLGYDSYSACCQWTDSNGNVWYCFGGWVKTPALLTTSSDMTNKYSYVVATKDFVNWYIPLADYDTASAGSSSTWACEVSDLIPTPAGLLILRGDGNYHPGVYLWTGSTTTNSASLITGSDSYSWYKGCVYQDYLIGVRLTSSYYGTISLADGLFTVAQVGITSTRPSRAGGTWAVPGSFDALGAIQNFGGIQWQGSCDGFYVGLYSDGSAPFVPCFVLPNVGSGSMLRVHGWRSPCKQIAGGLVWAVNCDDSGTDAYDAAPSYLLYMTEGGKIKVLMQGGHFGAIEVYNDRLYFGVNSGYHGNTYSRIRNHNPMLMSLPLEQIINGAPPPITENFSYSYTVPTGTFPNQSGGSGINGVIGGYPTLGYSRGSLLINSSVSGTLTIMTYVPTRTTSGVQSVVDNVVYGTVALTANTTTQINLANFNSGQNALIDGGILAFMFSAAGTLSGRIALMP